MKKNENNIKENQNNVNVDDIKEINEKIQKQINKLLEEKKLTSFENLSEEIRPVDYINTGFYSLNYIITRDINKGYPVGKIIELSGDPATGKTLLCTLAALNGIKSGYVVMYIDAEQSYNYDFAVLLAEKMGLQKDLVKNINYTVIDKIEDLQQVLIEVVNVFEKTDILKNVKGGLVIVDGIAFLSSSKEERDIIENREKVDMTKAKLMRQCFRVLKNKFGVLNIGVIISNHLIYDIGVMYGDPKTTPGGTAIPYASSVRLRLNSKKIIEDDRFIGIEMKVKCIKNRLTLPYLETKISLKFDGTFDMSDGLFEVLYNDRVIEKKNNVTYYFTNYPDITFTKNEFYEKIKKDKNFINLISQQK